MGLRSGYIKAGKFDLHYLEMGAGPRVLLAFHGYGNDAGLFVPFEQYLSDEFTILSIDLPHHGKSGCDEKAMDPEDLSALIGTVCIERNVESVSL